MKTECKPKRIEFQELGKREVVGKFNYSSLHGILDLNISFASFSAFFIQCLEFFETLYITICKFNDWRSNILGF
jgi:hypothetical protein